MARKSYEMSIAFAISYFGNGLTFYFCWLFNCLTSVILDPETQKTMYIMALIFASLTAFLLFLSLIFLCKDACCCGGSHTHEDMVDESTTMIKKGTGYYDSQGNFYVAQTDIKALGPLACLFMVYMFNVLGLGFYFSNIINAYKCLTGSCEKICNFIDTGSEDIHDCSSCGEYHCCCRDIDSPTCVSPSDYCGPGMFELFICIGLGVTAILFVLFMYCRFRR